MLETEQKAVALVYSTRLQVSVSIPETYRSSPLLNFTPLLKNETIGLQKGWFSRALLIKTGLVGD